MPLRLRRGTNAERLAITPASGELIYVTDTKRIFVGDGTTAGGVDIVASGGGSLQGSLNLNSYDIEGLGNINIGGYITNGTLRLDGNNLFSNEGFIASGSGNTIGILELGSSVDLLQFLRNWPEPVEPINLTYGITNGTSALFESNNVSRGTIASPDIVLTGDCLRLNRTYGYDGFDYVLATTEWHGVDPTETPSPGFIPGAWAITTTGMDGEHVLGFDSHGYLGINKYPDAAMEALDVVGNGQFTGTVSAAAFKGSFFADDSSLLVDGITGTLSNGTITLNERHIYSNDTFIAGLSGDTIGIIELGDANNPMQIKTLWKDSSTPFRETYGISSGTFSLSDAYFGVRGTFSAPTALTTGDNISASVNYGWDGSQYILSSAISHGVDFGASVTPGYVPGAILFFTNGPGGLNVSSQFNSDGYFGIRNGINPITEALDVTGNAKILGKIFTKSDDNVNSDIDLQFGISSGPASLTNSKWSSRGTLASPTALTPGDCITSQVNYGHDGTSYLLSSSIWCGVDGNASVTTGSVPGSILFFTNGAGGPNDVSGFDSNGNFGIKTGINAPAEALDVYGNIALNGRIYINAATAGAEVETHYGISSGLYSLITSKWSSRGTLASPTALTPGDSIMAQTNYGHDGTSYVFSSAISFSVDGNASVTTGTVPGAILFTTTGSSGYQSSSFDSNGFLGVRNGPVAATEALDVHGNAIVRGEVNAAAFKGTFVADDSTIVIDGLNGNVTGNDVTANRILYVTNSTANNSVQITGYANKGGTGYHDFLSVTNTYGSATNPNKFFRLNNVGTLEIIDSAYLNNIFELSDSGNVTAKGYVQFGSFTKTERDALSAANGMVVYNTTSNKFQGFQGGAWINLDDGLADP